MKALILFIIATVVLINSAFTQGAAINSTGAGADSSAMLDVSGTNKGILINRMTTSERNAISSPASSLLIFNTTTACFEFYYGGSWQSLGCACTVPSEPGSISGPVNPGCGSAGNIYSVTNVAGVTYNWSLPSGWLQTGGGTSDSITVTAGTSSGDITVTPSNTCGSGTAQTLAVSCISPGPCASLTAVADVINTYTGDTWMDRNLGALQQATSSVDAAAYGCLFQWGRFDDGHASRTSGITYTLSSSDDPGHSDFIVNTLSPYDWRSPQNDNLWQGLSGANNPCPGGYRLPTESELNNERLSWVQPPVNSTNTSAGAFASPLKLVQAGDRNGNSNGLVGNEGQCGRYWVSTVSGTSARMIYFDPASAVMANTFRAFGFSVRCIKD